MQSPFVVIGWRKSVTLSTSGAWFRLAEVLERRSLHELRKPEHLSIACDTWRLAYL